MPSLLRSRIYCFYCGTRSTHLKGSHVASFVCSSCEATNFLDKNGDITDVPGQVVDPQSAHPAPRYASSRSPMKPLLSNNKHPSARTAPPTLSSAPPSTISPTTDSLFCNACLQNQHFLTSCLADYLPVESDPQYAAYVAEYPAYRKKLEQRYPPVCRDCEPRVRAGLKKSAHVARTDVLERSLARRGRFEGSGLRRGWGWSMIVVVSWAWWVSLALQGLWHVVGAFGPFEVDLSADHGPLGFANVNLHLGRSGIAEMIGKSVPWAIAAGACLVWFNPVMHPRYDNTRFVGVRDYYAIQALVLLLRIISCVLVRINDVGSVDNVHVQAVHAFMVVFLISATIVSRNSIKIAPPPRFTMKDFEVDLVDRESFQMPKADSPSQASDLRPHQKRARLQKQFPIDQLAKSSQAAGPRSRFGANASISTRDATASPPDSESEHDSETTDHNSEAMDWEPAPPPALRDLSPHVHQYQSPATDYNQTVGIGTRNTAHSTSFRSVNNAYLAPPGKHNPSPFYGSLPPAPQSMESRLRKQARAPPLQFTPTPLSKQRDWFKKLRLTGPGSAFGSESGSASRFAMYGGNEGQSTDSIGSVLDNNGQGREGPGQEQGGPGYVSRIPGVDERIIRLRDPKWTLKSDTDAITHGTGLEDLFGTSFRIEDRHGGLRSGSGSGSGLGSELEDTGPRTGPAAAAAAVKTRMLIILLLPILVGLAVLATRSDTGISTLNLLVEKSRFRFGSESMMSVTTAHDTSAHTPVRVEDADDDAFLEA